MITKSFDESTLFTVFCPLEKPILSLINELFPRWAIKGVLEVCDTFIVPIPKKFSEHGVVGNSQRSPLISVSDNSYFNGISQNWHAVSFN